MRLIGGALVIGVDASLEAESISIIIPVDDDWPVRLAAAERLRRLLVEHIAEPSLTPQRRQRLKHALRTVDGRRDGASYRAIATVFFGARRVSQEPWKTSSLKAQIARLAAYGGMMIDRGYRRMLKGRLR